MPYKQGDDSGTAEMLPDYIGTLIIQLLKQEIMLFFLFFIVELKHYKPQHRVSVAQNHTPSHPVVSR